MDIKVVDLNGNTSLLSELGATVLSFNEAPAEIERVNQSFSGRNGSLDYGGRYASKTITANIMYSAKSISDDIEIQKKISALLNNIDGYYISQMYSNGNMYTYERPSVKTGSFNPSATTEANERFLVYRTDTNESEFVGKSGNTLFSKWAFEFQTKELPFGESRPRDQTLSSGGTITYDGTVKNSQLEQPFYFELTANQDSSDGFTLTIGSHKLEVSAVTKAGDKFVLAGINNTQNGTNINNLTNYDYFELLPSTTNKVTCSISASIVLKNVKDLFL